MRHGAIYLSGKNECRSVNSQSTRRQITAHPLIELYYFALQLLNKLPMRPPQQQTLPKITRDYLKLPKTTFGAKIRIVGDIIIIAIGEVEDSSDLYLFFTFSLPRFNFSDGKPRETAGISPTPGRAVHQSAEPFFVTHVRLLSTGQKPAQTGEFDRRIL